MKIAGTKINQNTSLKIKFSGTKIKIASSNMKITASKIRD